MSAINTNVELFSPQSLSLSSVLSGDSIYQIPDYQRLYSWTDEQVCQLWEDIFEAYKSNQEDSDTYGNYFLGSLIVIKNNAFEDVVDGQQRVTTLMILLCVIRQTYPKINHKVDAIENPTVVKKSKINSCISTTNEITRLRLQADPAQASNFDELVYDEDIDFSEYEKPTKKEIEAEPKHRYRNTAVLFYNYITSVGEEECGQFINYLMNNVKLIKITCYDEGFAIKLFQVLNDRGLDLSPADIIKGYLLSSLKGSENKHNHDKFMADWRFCEDWAKEVEVTLTDMFTYYMYYLITTNPKKSLVEELKEKFKDKNSNEVLRDFKNFIDCYRDIYYSDGKVISSMWYLPWATYWKTALIAAQHVKYKDLEELQKAMMRFFYLYYLSGKTLNSIKQTCYTLISNIKKKTPIRKIQKDLNAKLEEDEVIDLVLENLQGEVYYEKWIKHLLIIVEYWVTDGDEVAFIDTDPKAINIEHVYPQNPSQGSEWEKMFPNGADYLNTLGNLALLSGAKNRYAQNFTIAEKICIYQGFDKNGNKSGDKNGKVTVFQSTQQIVNDYKSKQHKQKWNEEAVQARYNWMCERIGEILDIDVTTILY